MFSIFVHFLLFAESSNWSILSGDKALSLPWCSSWRNGVSVLHTFITWKENGKSFTSSLVWFGLLAPCYCGDWQLYSFSILLVRVDQRWRKWLLSLYCSFLFFPVLVCSRFSETITNHYEFYAGNQGLFWRFVFLCIWCKCNLCSQAANPIGTVHAWRWC